MIVQGDSLAHTPEGNIDCGHLKLRFVILKNDIADKEYVTKIKNDLTLSVINTLDKKMDAIRK